MIKAKKSLGQNFLIDKNILEKITEITDIKNKTILEIGPGTGNLTSYILNKNPKKVIVVEKDFNLKIGETKQIDNFKFHLKDLKLVQDTNYKAVIGSLKVNDLLTKEERVLKPEIRIYENPQTLTYEASIKTNFFRDYYLTMSNIDRSDYYNIKFQEKPLMIWIWISTLIIMLGGMFAIFRKNKDFSNFLFIFDENSNKFSIFTISVRLGPSGETRTAGETWQ